MEPRKRLVDSRDENDEYPETSVYNKPTVHLRHRKKRPGKETSIVEEKTKTKKNMRSKPRHVIEEANKAEAKEENIRPDAEQNSQEVDVVDKTVAAAQNEFVNGYNGGNDDRMLETCDGINNKVPDSKSSASSSRIDKRHFKGRFPRRVRYANKVDENSLCGVILLEDRFHAKLL